MTIYRNEIRVELIEHCVDGVIYVTLRYFTQKRRYRIAQEFAREVGKDLVRIMIDDFVGYLEWNKALKGGSNRELEVD